MGKFGRAPAATSVRVRDYHLVPGATPEHRLAAEREFARLENLVAPQLSSEPVNELGHLTLPSTELTVGA